jgi:2-aminoadipate transaminase
MTDYDPLASVQAAGPPGSISLVYGLPDPQTFPVADLQRAFEEVFRERSHVALQYGPMQGYGPLIDYLRGRLAREQGLEIGRPQIMITGGSAHAIDQLCTIFSRPGDLVLVEAPTYFETLGVFRDHGLLPLQVPTDDGGLQIEALASRLAALAHRGERARFLYLIPTFQNPSGITLTGDRRQAVLDLAERYDLLILEDDVYRDLAYEADVPPSLFALDVNSHRNEGNSGAQATGGRRVLHIGSFSKILAPGVRMGWLLGPPGLIERVIYSGLRYMSGGASPLLANALATYCRQGLLEPHIMDVRQVYRERRDMMLSALAAHMPDGVRWTHPAGGVFVWLTLPEPMRAADMVERARKANLLILNGDPFFAESPTGQHLRLAFCYVTPDQIQAGVAILGQVLKDE